MPAPVLVYAGTAAGLALARKKENKRKQAAKNAFSQKYPLKDDCPSMEASIKEAKSELAQIGKYKPETKGQQRIKNRNIAALREWLNVMKNHNLDLKCGLNFAGSDVPPTSDYINPVVFSGTGKTPQTTSPVSYTSTGGGSMPAPTSGTTTTGGGLNLVTSPEPAPTPLQTKSTTSEAAPIGAAKELTSSASSGRGGAAEETAGKKKINWVVLGGIAVGALLIMNLLKKK